MPERFRLTRCFAAEARWARRASSPVTVWPAGFSLCRTQAPKDLAARLATTCGNDDIACLNNDVAK